MLQIQDDQPGRLEDLPALAPAARRGAAAARRPSSNENFDFYGKTLTGARRLRPRWKRCVDYTDEQLGEALGKKLRGEDVRRRGQGAHAEDGGRARKGAGRGHREALLDDAGDQEAGAGQAACDHQQDRLSGQVARLFERARSSATTRWATRPRRRSSSSSAQLRQDRQAGGPHGVGHDAAHGQRLLRSADEQHQFSGRHPAAAVLRQRRWTTR